jgi:hypothetical protein
VRRGSLTRLSKRATTTAHINPTALTANTTTGIADDPIDSIKGPIVVGTIKAPMAAAPTIHDVARAVSDIFSSTRAIMVGY